MYFYKIFFTVDGQYPVNAIVLSHNEKFSKEEFDKMVYEASKPIHYMDTGFVSKSLIFNNGFSLVNLECESDLYLL